MRRFPLPALGVVALLVGCQTGFDPVVAVPPPPLESQPTLSFQIAGPTRIDAKGTFTWEAFTFGGSGAYQYQWQVTSRAGSRGNGTGRRLGLIVTAADGDLLLSLRVTSGSQSKAQSVRVRNCIGGCAATP